MNTLHAARRRAPLALAVLVAAALLAACGSSSSSSSSTSSTSSTGTAASTGSTGSFAARRAQLQACLKTHGVTLPTRRPGSGGPPPGGAAGGGTPGAGGGLFGGGGAGGGANRFANNPKLAAAFKACGGAAFRGGRRRFQLSHTAITNFVACVRKHGFPSMPSPNFSGGAVFPTTLRTNPKFVSASKSCASLLVRPGAASGSGTTTSG